MRGVVVDDSDVMAWLSSTVGVLYAGDAGVDVTVFLVMVLWG